MVSYLSFWPFRLARSEESRVQAGVVDYDKLVLAELDAAASSTSKEQQRSHLDMAAQYAALGERERAGARTFFMLGEAPTAKPR